MKSEIISGPYFGQATPGESPERFSVPYMGLWPGSICQFAADGTEVYWSVVESPPDASNKRGTTNCYFMTLRDGTWTAPAVPSFSRRGDESPALAADGRRIYFFRRIDGRYVIHYADRIDGGWSEPIMPAIPAGSPLASPQEFSVAANGNIYFTHRANPKTINASVYWAKWVDGTWADPERLSTSDDSLVNEGYTYVAPDESYLLYCSEERSTSVWDMLVRFRGADGSWGSPIRLPAPVNTPDINCAPWVSGDGKYLFFISTRGATGGFFYWVDASVIESVRPK